MGRVVDMLSGPSPVTAPPAGRRSQPLSTLVAGRTAIPNDFSAFGYDDDAGATDIVAEMNRVLIPVFSAIDGECQITFPNWVTQNGLSDADSGPGNSITVKASVEPALATVDDLIPLTFDGASSVTIADGESATCDPFELTLPELSYLHVRVRVSVASASHEWPRFQSVSSISAGSAITAGTIDLSRVVARSSAITGIANEGERTSDGTSSLEDKTTSVGTWNAASGITGGGTNASGRMYRPSKFEALTDRATTGRRPPVVIFGDSIASTADSWLMRGLEAISVPVLNLGRQSESTWLFMPSGTSTGGITNGPQSWAAKRRALGGTPPEDGAIAVVQYGRNHGSYTGAQIIAQLQEFAAYLRTQGWERIVGCTITPQSTSSNAWVDDSGQTATAAAASVATANAWLRGTAVSDGTYEAVLDPAVIAESGTKAGVWANSGGVALTADGTHPNNLGKQTLAAAVSASVFEWLS